jgi:hypothetical protein
LQLLQQSEFGNYWPIAVYGDHRMGKSSLLRILDAKIPSTLSCLSTYIDIAAVSQDQFFAVIVKRVAELVYAAAGMGTIERTLREIKDSGAWHAAFGEINVDIMGFLKFKAAPSSEQHWERFVTILQALRARLDDYGTYHSIVLIFDEVSACANWTGSAELLKNWRSHIQALKGYNFIVADAHPLYQVSKDKWSAFFNVFSPVLLKGLAPEETIDLIVKPAAETGVQYAPPAVARIRELSGGKPFYIQVICCTVFERLLKDRNTTYVTAGLVESCIDGVLDRLGEHFVAFWSNLTDFQKEYLLSIVHKQSVDLAPRSKTKLFEEQRTQIKRLEERQLVTVDEYKIARIDPLLREWINRYYT